MRVLLVEDDVRFAAVLMRALRRCGHEPQHVQTVGEASRAVGYDFALVDLTLPDGDGVALCRSLREERDDLPIIVLTARSEPRDRVGGLRAGADDYMVKPVAFEELQARIEAVVRRVRPRPMGQYRLADLLIDFDTHRVWVGERQIEVTRKEFQILALLMREPGAIVPRDRVLVEVWHTTWQGTMRTLNVHMTNLRNKLDHAATIETVRGVGYRIVAGHGIADGGLP
jgi:DNA-binding response OmpR family regulator